MKCWDESKKKNINRTQSCRALLVLASIALLVAGFITAPSIISAQTTTTSTPSNATTVESRPTNITNTASSSAAPKPVDGYNTPIGHLSAIRHVFDDPTLRVQHYCKPNDKIVLVCQLYDSTSGNATLIGMEYIITADQYNSLPAREKLNWHYHKIEFAPDRANPMFPELSSDQTKAVMGKLMDTYGKVIITWNPRDKLPAFPPQIEQVQHPFMVNSTAKPETNGGSFNQTLKY